MLNRTLLSDVRDQIRTRPHLHDNRYWAARIKTGTASMTTHCVGGWAIVLSGGAFDWHPARCRVRHARRRHVQTSARIKPGTLPGGISVSQTAQLLLGLDDATARSLFNPTNSHADVLNLIERILAEPSGAADAPCLSAA